MRLKWKIGTASAKCVKRKKNASETLTTFSFTPQSEKGNSPNSARSPLANGRTLRYSVAAGMLSLSHVFQQRMDGMAPYAARMGKRLRMCRLRQRFPQGCTCRQGNYIPMA